MESESGDSMEVDAAPPRNKRRKQSSISTKESASFRQMKGMHRKPRNSKFQSSMGLKVKPDKCEKLEKVDRRGAKQRISVTPGPKHLIKSDKPRKRRDGTPGKSAISTVSQEAVRDEMATRANIIWNDEIEALGIKEEDLQKFHKHDSPTGKTSPQQTSIVIKKTKSPQKIQSPKKKLIVAKPALTDTPLKPVDHIGNAGLRYDENGDVIPHSILGNYEDFYNEAIRRGDILDLPEPKPQLSQTPSPIKLPHTPPQIATSTHIDESNALKHWQRSMDMRKQTINHIANTIQKNPDVLLMATTDQYRTKQEQRHLIDRAIPLVDYGKGHRVYSEFWQQQPQLGDEDRGIHVTLTQTERGFAPPIEQLGSSGVAKNEKGVEMIDSKDKWWKSEYMAQRTTQLGRFIKEIRPHKPDFIGLEVIGSNNPEINVGVYELIPPHSVRADKENVSPRIPDEDPLSKYPDVYPEIIFGPSISFAGQPARWTGDSHQFRGQTAIEARVAFEVLAGNWVVSKLQIINDGTTAIYYSWEKVHKENPFGVHHETVQRFYFNTSNGVILPNDSIKFPFVFKSSTGGVYTEQWRFITSPVVCGGADLLVTLRGVAVQEDKFCHTRVEIEDMLHERQTTRIVEDILADMVGGVRTPQRSRSPIDAYITEEELFSRANPELYYHMTQIEELHEIYGEICPEKKWDLSVHTIKKACMGLEDELEEKREEILHKLNEIVVKLSFPKFLPKLEHMNRVGCQILREAIDNMVGQSMFIRNSMKMITLESRDTPTTIDEDKKKSLATDSKKEALQTKKSATKGLTKAPIEKAGKADVKSVKSSGGKSKHASRSGTSRGETRSVSPPEVQETPDVKIEDDIELDQNKSNKYYEKLYTQTYLILNEAIGKMADAFEELHEIDKQNNENTST